MASTVAKYPRTVESAFTWANDIDNVKIADNISSTRNGNGYIVASNFDFNIPNGSTIKGIVVEVYASSAGLYGDNSGGLTNVSLMKNGFFTGGVNRASDDPSPWSPATMEIRTYGSPIELWGFEWTAADINESIRDIWAKTGFGVEVLFNSSPGHFSISIDAIRITVYYVPSPVIDITNANPYTGKTLTGKILTDTVTPKVRINGVLIDNKAHEMLLQPVTVLVTTKTTYEQAKGK